MPQHEKKSLKRQNGGMFVTTAHASIWGFPLASFSYIGIPPKAVDSWKEVGNTKGRVQKWKA